MYQSANLHKILYIVYETNDISHQFQRKTERGNLSGIIPLPAEFFLRDTGATNKKFTLWGTHYFSKRFVSSFQGNRHRMRMDCGQIIIPGMSSMTSMFPLHAYSKFHMYTSCSAIPIYMYLHIHLSLYLSGSY